MQINDLTNDLELVWSTSEKETVPKFGLRTRILGDMVYLILPAGGYYAATQQASIKIDYNDVTSPVVATAEELRDYILDYASTISLGGGAGGAGGGSIVYTNAAGDFKATPNNGTKNITITGLPFTLEALHVVGGSIKKVAVTTNVVTNVRLTDVSVAGGVITLADADDFATGDAVYVTLIGPDKWYDRDLDNAKALVQNPDYAHYTDVEHLLDITDATVDQHYSSPISPESYSHLAIQITANAVTGGAGVVFKFWATLNPDAALPADLDAAPSTDWVDWSEEVLGAATVTLGTAATESEGYVLDAPTMFERYLLQYDPGHATNTVDVFIRKFSV